MRPIKINHDKKPWPSPLPPDAGEGPWRLLLTEKHGTYAYHEQWADFTLVLAFSLAILRLEPEWVHGFSHMIYEGPGGVRIDAKEWLEGRWQG